MKRSRLIDVRNLSFEYERGSIRGTTGALSDINLQVNSGEFVVITGPSGCGKSTLCKCLNGLIPHAIGGMMDGEVTVCGMNTTEHEVFEFAPHLCMVFQDPDNQLFSNDVESEIAFGPENLGIGRHEVAERISLAISSIGIEHLRDRLISELSGGEKQRVAIASAIAMKPDILVFDEPTSELDPTGAFLLMDALKRLNKEFGITVILVEHRIERLLGVMKRLIVLKKGKITCDGTPEEVFQTGLENMGVFIPPLVQFSKKFGFPLHQYRSVDDLNPCCGWRSTFNGHGGNGGSGGSRSREPAVSLKNIFYRYPGTKNQSALSGVTLNFYCGEFTVIMGENGSGKTTLIKHLNGLLRPNKGEVILNGENITNKTIAEAGRTVGLVFQNASYQLFEETIYGELAFAPKNIGLSDDEIADCVNGVATSLGLEELGLSSSPLVLSGGEMQRVAIAGVLTLSPEVIVMDEPTLGLDHGLKAKLAAMLNRLKAENRAIIVVTHDVEFAAAYAERVVLLSKGEIIGDGSAREVLTSEELVKEASLHLPQATEIGKRLGLSNVLSVDEIEMRDQVKC
ncbi:MAG: energy-coupling factor transport system ATP-binding protein [Candidatus Argoarchaeum ethanivorans]|uniref:Energy-coupling factor transport system ATP-binding protein n=1 Tax=Candidatus Argoarchaeum ethanivorans TaxID=2608793 RepID=A0A8B3RZK6_9EURY|nr:MAG: energy-coupling factor transport system ATP-binding protein [Candidatus Argoarchaeum ethanivorans]